jgi:hypothetical protein
MSHSNRKLQRTTDSDLERVIEPLASYICATSRPKAALRLALTALCHQVEHTNLAATARVAAFSSGLSVA